MPTDPCDSNYVALKHHFDALREADQRALENTARALEHKLESMNEFRSQINAERGQYITRELYDAQSQTMVDRIASLESWRAWSLGAGSVLILLAGVVGGIVSKMFGI